MSLVKFRHSLLLYRRCYPIYRCHRKFSAESLVTFSSKTVQAGYLWFSELQLTGFLENVLVSVHDYGHLPWWATILVGAVGLRLCAFPLYRYQEQVRAKRYHMEAKVLQEMLARKPVIASKTEFAFRQIAVISRQAETYNLKMGLIVALALFPLPWWWCMTVGIQKLSGNGFSANENAIVRPEMSKEGLLWSKNFLQPDSQYIWPVATCVTLLLNSRANRVDKKTKYYFQFLYRWRRTQFTLLAFACLGLSSVLPACIGYFWFVGATSSLIQFLLFQHPVVKKFLVIKPYPWDTRRPFRALFGKLRIEQPK